MPKVSLLQGIGCLILSLIFCFTSCRKDLEYELSSISLRFSQDTVFLDTIFTQSNSETYLVKVYNESDDDISIPNIYLNQRSNSSFRVNLDGMSGFEFAEIPLRANDSLMIFVEMALGDSDENMVEEDELVFADSNQQIKLLAFAENAVYHYPAEGEDYFTLNDNTTWGNAVSHVIYGNMKLAASRTLNIEAGSKIYFHNNSSLEILENGNLNLNGTIENPIIIRGDRHDARYDSLPKQWNQIKLINATLNSQNAIIKGGTNGFVLDNSTATIHNTQIYNMSSSGIFALNAIITGTNVAISDAGDACLNVENGGTYNFYYSSFANNWETGLVGISGPNIPAYLSNYTVEIDENDNETETQENLNGFFANCIFYGQYPNGVYLDEHDGASLTVDFESCLIKNNDTALFDFSGFNPITDNPLFNAAIFSQQDLRLQSESPAIGNANTNYNSFAPQDIKGNTRGNSPNLGAYQEVVVVGE